MTHHILLRATVLVAILLTAFVAQAAVNNVRIRNVDRIVAVVNSDVITQRELDDRMATVMAQLRKQKTELPPREVLERQVLERLIVDRAQLQLAKETGIRVDDVQLDQTLQRIAEQNGVSMAAFRATLEKDGVSFSKFREEVREEIMLSRLREREVDSRVTVSDSEVDAFLASRNAARGGGADEYRVAHILVTVPEQAGSDEVRERKNKAEAALAELKKGASFAQVAAAYSEAPDAMEGGELGWRSAARLPTLFVETLEKMHPGELSPVLRSPNGFHILKLHERRGKNAPMVVQQTHARHILIKTNEAMSEADALRKLTQIRERLVLGGADFGELAKQYSEDGSASRGGDLGWINPGDTVSPFEQAMNALKEKEVSAPVKSPFGWHLIQVLERRQQDVSNDRTRMQARQEIRARKADEQFQDWVRQLRDRAYVEYRLEEKE